MNITNSSNYAEIIEFLNQTWNSIQSSDLTPDLMQKVKCGLIFREWQLYTVAKPTSEVLLLKARVTFLKGRCQLKEASNEHYSDESERKTAVALQTQYNSLHYYFHQLGLIPLSEPLKESPPVWDENNQIRRVLVDSKVEEMREKFSTLEDKQDIRNVVHALGELGNTTYWVKNERSVEKVKLDKAFLSRVFKIIKVFISREDLQEDLKEIFDSRSIPNLLIEKIHHQMHIYCEENSRIWNTDEEIERGVSTLMRLREIYPQLSEYYYEDALGDVEDYTAFSDRVKKLIQQPLFENRTKAIKEMLNYYMDLLQKDKQDVKALQRLQELIGIIFVVQENYGEKHSIPQPEPVMNVFPKLAVIPSFALKDFEQELERLEVIGYDYRLFLTEKKTQECLLDVAYGAKRNATNSYTIAGDYFRHQERGDLLLLDMR